ncbi:hypothetical protein N9971_00750 [bacterium]|nr:hypothetical protein [bacterium]
MSDTPQRIPSVGSSIDDYCRVCKISRGHRVEAVVPDPLLLRVVCDYCGSRHNYRGRPSVGAPPGRPSNLQPKGEAMPLVSERERSFAPMHDSGSGSDLEMMLRRVIREETGLTPIAPADKWRDGDMVLRPGRPDVQEKSWPIETFFNKVVMVRNRLRTLEQQVNGADIPQELKVKLQGYITASYGSLTSFNVLFADEDDRFRGSGGK